MKAVFEYKCRRCGETSTAARKAEFKDEPDISDYLDAMHTGGGYLIHKCPDNNHGIADLIGYRTEG